MCVKQSIDRHPPVRGVNERGRTSDQPNGSESVVEINYLELPRAMATFIGSPDIDPDTSTMAIILPRTPF